ncbi:hypothetical protein FKP32DRAFT_1608533 [Trametes sanguinea]|nr:hypothetical protein FKP32DRAFT_1608533 [Trametes sanguinea]
MVARIPYLITVPRSLTVASEVATMTFLRSCGLPIPQVYGHSPTTDNAGGTEYIFMEFIDGTNLNDIWFDLDEHEISSVMRQLVQLEATMMSIHFPAGGSLYYASDLEKLSKDPGVPMEDHHDQRYCLGPDTRLPLWVGKRSQLDVYRGPYENVEAALVAGAQKELTYLRRFGQPVLPFRRVRREAYGYQEQSPTDHVENLERYLLIAPSLVPKDLSLNRFRIRHPDLNPNNVIVTKSSDSHWQVVGVLDWQHAAILPMFLLAGIPGPLQNYGDPISEYMAPPSLPPNLADMDESERTRAEELYRRRLVHNHYVKSTEKYNGSHYAALTDPMGVLRRRLFCYASEPWEGETLELKAALIEATGNWRTLSGTDAPCPVRFDAEDVQETMKLEAEQQEADEVLQDCLDVVGAGTEGWVPVEHYEEAMARSKRLKENALASATSDQERAEVAAHWPLDDMDETRYM